MVKNFFTPGFRIDNEIQIFKSLLLLFNMSALVLYAFLRFLFHDFPFEWQQELSIVLKAGAIASALAFAISFIVLVADLVEYLLSKKMEISFRHTLL